MQAGRFLSSRADPDEYDFDGDGIFYDGDDGEIAFGGADEAPNGLFASNSRTSVPEKFNLTLPSAMTARLRKERNLSLATDREIQLRIGQCNDALQGVRLALGKKAFLFRTQIRPKGPKTGKTRSWGGIHTADSALREQAQIYRAARTALQKLEPPQEILQKYQVLEPKDLKTSTTLLDDSIRGQKHERLPWFWSLDVAGDVTAAEQMLECKYPKLSSYQGLIGRFSSSGQLAEGEGTL